MKIRTDFVTNSSSSSFIFNKNFNLSEFKKKIRNRFGDREDDIAGELKYIANNIKSIKDFLDTADEFDIIEVIEWYTDEILDDINIEIKEDRERAYALILLDLIYLGNFDRLITQTDIKERNIKILTDNKYAIFTDSDLAEKLLELASNNFDEYLDFISNIENNSSKIDWLIYVFEKAIGAGYVFMESSLSYQPETEEFIKNTESTLVSSSIHMG